jgi:hypothetical protein
MLMSVLLGAVLAISQPVDSATVTLRPHDKTVRIMAWVAFDATGREIDRGTTPTVTKQQTSGQAVTYCTDNPSDGFLELVVTVRAGKMTAWATCTRVTVRGIAVKTEGVPDPRQVDDERR